MHGVNKQQHLQLKQEKKCTNAGPALGLDSSHVVSATDVCLYSSAKCCATVATRTYGMLLQENMSTLFQCVRQNGRLGWVGQIYTYSGLNVIIDHIRNRLFKFGTDGGDEGCDEQCIAHWHHRLHQ